MERVIDVFPMPPAPVRAIGLRVSARPATFSIRPVHPKQALGGGMLQKYQPVNPYDACSADLSGTPLEMVLEGARVEDSNETSVSSTHLDGCREGVRSKGKGCGGPDKTVYECILVAEKEEKSQWG